MGAARDAITLSPTMVALTLAIGGALIAGLVTLVVLLGRKFGEVVQKKMQDVEGYGKKLEAFFEAQGEKDRIHVERLAIVNERMKNYDKGWDTLQARLQEGTQTMRSQREELDAQKKAQDSFEKESVARQAKFEQEIHTRQLEFAGQWQTTLVGMAERFVSKDTLEDFRCRHEQDHGRLEQRMAHQEQLTEKMTSNILGIEKKLEGGIHTIAALLAKHITVGKARNDDEPCKPDDDQG